MLYYLTALPALIESAREVPAWNNLQVAYFSELDERFPQGVDWQVAWDGLVFPEFSAPAIRAPRCSDFESRLYQFLQDMNGATRVDLGTALDDLTADLQQIIDDSEQLWCVKG